MIVDDVDPMLRPMACVAALTHHNEKARTAVPEIQEQKSSEANNSTPDKVIVKLDNLESTVWHFFFFWILNLVS